MMYGHYPNKIEKTCRCGKAMRMTFVVLLVLPLLNPCDMSAAIVRCGRGTTEGRADLRIAAARVLCLSDGGDLRERGPRASGMGGCAAALQGSTAAALFNPAALSAVKTGGSVFWTPARFGLTELGSAAGVWVQAFDGGAVAVSLQRFGYALYAEHRLGCAASVPLTEDLSVGLRLSALHIEIARYGSTMLPLVDAGVRCRIADGLSAGAVAFAVNMPSIDGDERLPSGLSMGLAWQDDDFCLAVEAEKEARADIGLRMGAEYRIFKLFQVRCGAATLTGEWTAGLGVRRSSFRVAYAVAIHSELGATHTIGIGFEP